MIKPCSKCKKRFTLNKRQEKDAKRYVFAGFLCPVCLKWIKEKLIQQRSDNILIK